MEEIKFPRMMEPAKPPEPILITLCKVDGMRIYTGENKKQDIKNPIPSGWIAIEPPLKDGIFQFRQAKWVELNQYPVLTKPTIAPKTIYDRKDFVDILVKAGLADTLGVMLAQAPIAIREQWYANPTIDIKDPRVVDFFRSANVDITALLG